MKIILHFTNLDNFMDTKEEATVVMQVTVDSLSHATLLGQHLQRVLQADYYTIED